MMMVMMHRLTRAIAVCGVCAILSSCSLTNSSSGGEPLSIAGRVETDEFRIGAIIPGKVLRVFVREGATVKTGQQLILLDDSAFRKQLVWLDKLSEKGAREKAETERLLATMKDSLKKAKDYGNLGRSVATKTHASVSSEKNAPEIASSGSNKFDFTIKQLNELARRQTEQRHRLEQLSKQAEAEADSGFAQQKQILSEARQAEKKVLAKYNAFPLNLMGKGKDSSVDTLFDAKENELEALHNLQKQSIAETAKMNQMALNEGFELQRESLQSLEQARAMISAQFQQERQKTEDLLKTKQVELTARLSKFDNPDFMEKTMHELESAQADKQSLMAKLSKDQLRARLALIDAEQTKAEALREEINYKIEACSIKSPVDGVCVSLAVQPGEIVAPGPVLLKVADMKAAYLRAFVPARELVRIKVGQKAEIRIAGADWKAIPSTITEIDTQAAFSPQNVYSEQDLLERQYGIKLSLDTSDGLAKPGMSGQATILPASKNVQ
ncbi:MAG: efflux RND transporter periplasmic adaptor subunit [Candidatus Obscuribacterales bacterium]|nr:efflux RND transporter periplasmic adaptor subunit [Candidatus Obscuribacterales bacterium]